MDGEELEVKLARLEVNTDWIKSEVTEIKHLLSQHVVDDRNNFDSLTRELNANKNLISFAKGKLSGITLVGLVIWSIAKEIFSLYH